MLEAAATAAAAVGVRDVRAVGAHGGAARRGRRR